MENSIIVTENLCKSFPGARNGNDLHVLNGINLSIERGEIFGIIGRSGAGKSTLVRCINFLERPSLGEVVFEGVRLSGLKKHDLYRARQSMGMIFQQFNLLMQRTALDNVRFPMEIAGWNRQAARQRAAELLDMVGMREKQGSYPAQLSGGQRQRVAIARAIALNPKVLLCDEATSALDPETTRGVLELIHRINREFNITVIVITHEMQVIQSIAERVAVLDNGGIAELGSVTEVFTKPQSDAAKRFIYPEGGERTRHEMPDRNRLRVVFNGNSSFEPVIAGMVLHFRQKVNILYADTRDVGGKAFGQMILQIPDDLLTAAAMREYLENLGLETEDVNDDI